MMKRILVSLSFLTVSLLTGCAKEAEIRGIVTFEGIPVNGGTIIIDNAETNLDPSYGQIQPGGSYTVTDLTPGKKIITARALRSSNVKVGPNGLPVQNEETDSQPVGPLEYPDNAIGNGLDINASPGSNVINL